MDEIPRSPSAKLTVGLATSQASSGGDSVLPDMRPCCLNNSAGVLCHSVYGHCLQPESHTRTCQQVAQWVLIGFMLSAYLQGREHLLTL